MRVGENSMPNLLQESNSFNHSDRTKGLLSQTTKNSCRDDTCFKSWRHLHTSHSDCIIICDWTLLKAEVNLTMSALSRFASIICKCSILIPPSPLLRVVTISCSFGFHSASLSTSFNLKRMDRPSEKSLRLPDLPTSLSAPSSSSQIFATGAWPEHPTGARPKCRF